jgi:hypothetical protein
MPGFLGTRASLMLDVVFLAMFAVVPILFWSIYLVRVKRNYALHKRVQVTLSLVLAVAVTLFEVDMRFFTGWRNGAQASPYYSTGMVEKSLLIHLCFAVTTAVVWSLVVVRALRNIPSPPGPCAHSVWHGRWGWIAALDMLGTSVTGWIFYYLAYVAK